MHGLRWIPRLDRISKSYYFPITVFNSSIDRLKHSGFCNVTLVRSEWISGQGIQIKLARIFHKWCEDRTLCQSLPTELLHIIELINWKWHILFISPDFVVKLDLWHNKLLNCIVWEARQFLRISFLLARWSERTMLCEEIVLLSDSSPHIARQRLSI